MAKENENANKKTNEELSITARKRFVSRTSATANKRKKQKKAALIVGLVAFLGISFLGILAYLGQISSNFTIGIDPRPTDPTLRLTYDPTDSSGTETYLTSDGLTNAWPTNADEVISWAKTFYEKTENTSDTLLYGNNILDNHDSPRYVDGEPVINELALMYTFYLYNDSEGDVNYMQKFTVTNYKSPTNSAREPYDYLRVAVFENDYVKVGEQTHNYQIYGLENTNSQTLDGYENGISDYRECISRYTESKKRDEETGKEVTCRSPGLNSLTENNDYCVPFISSKGTILQEQRSISGKQMRRYTVLIWLEGEDPDSYGKTPKDSSLTFSLEFTNL